MSLQKTSLQARLTLLALGAVLLFSLSAGYESYENAIHEADEIFDAQLAHFAQNLAIVASHSDQNVEHVEDMPEPEYDFQKIVVFQVWSISSAPPKSIFRSSNIPAVIKAQVPDEGFSDVEFKGQRWRYYRQRDEKRGLDVLVGENDKDRHELARKVAWSNIAPSLFGLPLLALFIMLAIYFGLRPLRKLTESLRQLSPEQLAPIELQKVPREIAPVVGALNSLLERIARTIENERRFTADASHELRTPLAALQAQAQAAQLSDNKAERMECLDKVMQGADRMSHLVGQLLTLSRLDEFSATLDGEPLNLADIVQESCAELGPRALAKNIGIELAAEAQPALSGSADLLRIMLGNLLDNAIRYTPEGGRVKAALRLTDAGQAEIEIADSGAGVNDENLSLLGQRFNRLNQTGETGVGLGLSIVRRIAEIHRAEVAFARAAELGGLSVTVTFSPQHAGK
ncbi:MAG: sensor histidine kinase N-terminal domain-containing protein [Nitrosomonadales bacterium]|nr:sensor histidine kinase N-terminal domain-containing protein [Nitrosomonadales bacterium]